MKLSYLWALGLGLFVGLVGCAPGVDDDLDDTDDEMVAETSAAASEKVACKVFDNNHQKNATNLRKFARSRACEVTRSGTKWVFHCPDDSMPAVIRCGDKKFPDSAGSTTWRANEKRDRWVLDL